ncbi:MAG: allantoicase [Myxococcota bacterium]|jgi:allantoicase
MSDISAFSGLVDLARDGHILGSSDDFFAEASRLLRPDDPVFIPGKYTDRGKWMDGWESRRRRVPGHDWCILALGLPGVVAGVDINTAHFLGNHPPFASIEGCTAPADATLDHLLDAAEWTEILSETALQRGSHNLAAVHAPGSFTHLRLRIYPAGGVARLRVYGAPSAAETTGEVDLVGLAQGGKALSCSDMFFSPMNNLLRAEEPEDMGGGWETRRSRPPGDDWVILALGRTGRLTALTVGTLHFKGNYPDQCSIEAIRWPDAPAHALIDSPDWTTIVPSTPLRAHHNHRLPVTDGGPWTHLRLRIVPDGGVSRLRAWGTSDDTPGTDPLLTQLNDATPDAARAILTRCCGARRWVDAMVTARPFVSRAHLHGTAEVAWWRLAPSDWREAFTHHPRIGTDRAKLREKFAATADWAEGEQAGVQGASEETIEALAIGNAAYEARYGHIFIVCASGLTAAQMLDHLSARMHTEPHIELARAAGEQAKITRIRLEKQ